jgi:hypothetical protein
MWDDSIKNDARGMGMFNAEECILILPRMRTVKLFMHQERSARTLL